MITRALLAVPLCLLLSGCASVVGTHPFSTLPKSSGNLDKTPEVLILRGQAPNVCREGDKTRLVFFVYLRWMPPTEVFVSVNGGKEVRLFGTALTVNVKADSPITHLVRHTLEVKVGKRFYTMDTLVGHCHGKEQK